MPMTKTIPAMIERLNEWKGQLIAYGGGGSVSLFSNQVAAKASETVEVVTAMPDITTANMISLGGLVLIAFRLIFDIYAYFDKKRERRERTT